MGVDFVHPVEAVIPGAQGRVLGVLARTTAELNLRTLARLAGVSTAQVSRVMPGLVELGLVRRRDVPPSSLFTLVRSHIAANAVLALATAHDTVLHELGALAASIKVAPVSMIVFGSFARGEAVTGSDIDAVFIRPDDVPADDAAWVESIESWRSRVQERTGNCVEVLELSRDEARSRVASARPLWRDIRRDGQVVYGLNLDQLGKPAHASAR